MTGLQVKKCAEAPQQKQSHSSLESGPNNKPSLNSNLKVGSASLFPLKPVVYFRPEQLISGGKGNLRAVARGAWEGPEVPPRGDLRKHPNNLGFSVAISKNNLSL